MDPRRPFDPAKAPFYYGWVIVVVGSIGVLASVPGQTAGVSVFTDHLSAATGLSRLQLSIAYLCGTGASGLLLPIGGRWIDVWGSRRVALGASLGLAATLVGLSLIGPMSVSVGLIVMTVGFAFLRFTGQGLLTLTSRTMISHWFEERRGLVSSVSNTVVSFAFAMTPVALFRLVDASGFRLAWRQIAVALAVGFAAIVIVFFRDTPEASGLLVDGKAHPPVGTDPETTTTDDKAPRLDPPSVTRHQALRDSRFWILTIPVVAQAAVGTALTFHIVDFGREVGMDEAAILKIFLPIALVSVPISIAGGWMIDRVSPLQVAVVMATAEVVMYLTAGQLDQPFWRVVAVTSWGIAQGCFAPLTSAAIPRYFGRKYLGAINGAQMSAMVFGSAVGPAFFSLVEQFAGSYRVALLWSISMPLAGLALAATRLRRPRTGAL